MEIAMTSYDILQSVRAMVDDADQMNAFNRSMEELTRELADQDNRRNVTNEDLQKSYSL